MDKAHFHIWTEDEGRRNAVEVCSSLLTFFNISTLGDESTKLVACSDSCGGQNKNFPMFCFWQYIVLSRRFKSVQHKILTSVAKKFNLLHLTQQAKHSNTFLHTSITHANFHHLHSARNIMSHRNISQQDVTDVVTSDITNTNVHKQQAHVTGATQTCTWNKFVQLNFYHAHIVQSLATITERKHSALCGRNVSATLILNVWHLKTQQKSNRATNSTITTATLIPFHIHRVRKKTAPLNMTK